MAALLIYSARGWQCWFTVQGGGSVGLQCKGAAVLVYSTGGRVGLQCKGAAVLVYSARGAVLVYSARGEFFLKNKNKKATKTNNF